MHIAELGQGRMRRKRSCDVLVMSRGNAVDIAIYLDIEKISILNRCVIRSRVISSVKRNCAQSRCNNAHFPAFSFFPMWRIKLTIRQFFLLALRDFVPTMFFFLQAIFISYILKFMADFSIIVFNLDLEV